MAVNQFGFAWLSAEDEAWSGSLFRNDENVISWKVSASEGDCDTADVTIKNPKRGLLNGSIWASISYGTSGGDAVELFRGRLTGIPADILSETVDLLLIAKPSSFDQQKATLAAQLRTLPPYDAIWVDPTKRNDPDAVLESQSALYFCDRVSHNLSITDMINGEDGIVSITADDILYDSLHCGPAGDPPLTSVTMIGHANWKQKSSTGFPVPNANGSRPVLNGASLCSSWPKTGDTLAGGYSVTQGFCEDVYGFSFMQPVTKHWSYENRQKTHSVGDVMSSNVTWTVMPGGGNLFLSNIKTQTGLVPAASTVAYEETESGGYTQYDPYASIDGSISDVVSIPNHVSYNANMIPIWRINYGLSLGIDAGANAAETIQFTIASDLQQLVTFPDPTIVTTTIELSTQDLTSDSGAGNTDGVPTTGVGPPLDSSSDSFAATDRGAYAIGYLVAVGRAAIRKAARATSVTGTVTFEKAIQFTLRKNIDLTETRLPAGHVMGKITAYSFGFDGQIATGTFEILPAVGNSGSIGAVGAENTYTPSPGTNTYVDNWVDNWTATAGGSSLIPGAGTTATGGAGDISYTVDPYTAAGITNLTAADAIVSSYWFNGSTVVQVGADDMADGTTRPFYTTAITDKFHLELRPLSNIDLGADVSVTTSTLNIAKQIDLSAAPL